MKAAQKARWQKIKRKQPAKKRKMSAEGGAAIIAGVKARWAKIRAQGKSKL